MGTKINLWKEYEIEKKKIEENYDERVKKITAELEI